MADNQKLKQKRLQRRKWSVRSKLFGTPQRPRLSVYRSEKHIYAQLVDDFAGTTLASASSLSSEVRGDQKNGANIAAAQAVGRVIAEHARAAGITTVTFDRGGRVYHGRVKALADAAREGGLKF